MLPVRSALTGDTKAKLRYMYMVHVHVGLSAIKHLIFECALSKKKKEKTDVEISFKLCPCQK